MGVSSAAGSDLLRLARAYAPPPSKAAPATEPITMPAMAPPERPEEGSGGGGAPTHASPAALGTSGAAQKQKVPLAPEYPELGHEQNEVLNVLIRCLLPAASPVAPMIEKLVVGTPVTLGMGALVQVISAATGYGLASFRYQMRSVPLLAASNAVLIPAGLLVRVPSGSWSLQRSGTSL
ncbi:hypothetical protein DFJ74DRAFT_687509 [Hyaloraphidium curvatum]|nr:hypothetical protein DFJ74DRAFT_687509 [Hyaloraphidium curvatum]